MTPSSSAGLEPVFQEILAAATRFCEADSGCVLLCNAAGFETAAVSGATPAFADSLRRGPLPAGPSSALRWVATEKSALHFPDLAAEAAYQRHEPDWAAAVALEGARTGLHVPMLRGDDLIGIVTMYRRVKRPFTEDQIALARTFAGQAVVASENVRLLQDLQSRDRELAEGLDQQRATSEILRVIANSPTALQPVLDAVAENAARACGATDAVIMRIQGKSLRLWAHYGPIPTVTEAGEPLQPLHHGFAPGRAVLDRKTIHIADVAEADTEFPLSKKLGRLHGFRTVLATPLVREGVPIGVIGIRRMEVQPFSDRQIELLKTFADQAVIAIENVRLFNETTEALEQQTASSEILGVISSSPTDLRPVFDAILESATRLCDAHLGVLNLFEGEMCRTVAQRGGRPEFAKWVLERGAFRPAAAMAHVLAERRPLHVPDAREGALRRATRTR